MFGYKKEGIFGKLFIEVFMSINPDKKL